MESWFDVEPPHLSISVVGDGADDDAVFRMVCSAVLSSGEDLHGRLELCVPDPGEEDGNPPRRIVDLPGGSRTASPKSNDGIFAHGTAVRASIEHPTLGRGVVSFDKTESDSRPVTLSVASQELGLPAEVRQESEQRSAQEIAGEAFRLTRTICEQSLPLYATVGIEASLPGPLRFRTGDFRVDSLYFSDRLLRMANSDRAALREAFGRSSVIDWDEGVYVSCWDELTPPFVHERVVLTPVTPRDLRRIATSIAERAFDGAPDL
jgi:hypothetical protein